MEQTDANIIGTFISMPNVDKMNEVAPPYFILDVLDAVSEHIKNQGPDILDIHETNIEHILKFYDDSNVVLDDKIKSLILLKLTYERIANICEESLEAIKNQTKPLVKQALAKSPYKNPKGKPIIKLNICESTYRLQEIDRKGNINYDVAKLQEYLTQDEIKSCQKVGRASQYIKIEEVKSND